MNFKEFKSNIEKGLNAKSDYQKRVLCYIINNGKSEKRVMCEMLNQYHLDMNKTPSHFMGCPVWGVLVNKGMIKQISNSNSYDITIRPNEDQRVELIAMCKTSLKSTKGYLEGNNQFS